MARIKSVDISNIMGTKQASFRPGSLTIISGRNGEGKTSLITALLRSFDGGHDPSLLRKGAKLGEILLTLDDGTTIKVRITEKSTTYEIKDAAGNEVKAPRSYIEQLGDSLSVDPSKFVIAKQKDLAAALLEVMPVTFEPEEIAEAVGDAAAERDVPMDLERFEAYRKEIYEARTAENRLVRDAEGMIRQLSQSLPEDDKTDWAKRTQELRDLLQEARQARDAEIATISREEQESIDAIRQQAERLIEEARKEARQKRSEKDAEFEPTLAKINAALGESEERMRAKDKAEGLRRSIEEFRDRKEKADRSAMNLTRAIERLDELKAEKLASLPIPGLVVMDGKVLFENVPFERVNLAKRIDIAFQIAALRAKDLPFMVLDEAENMDSTTWEAFKEAAANSGFQVVAARVSDGPLSIEVIEPEAVPA